MRLAVEGECYSCEAVFVAKGRYYAGPWTFAPHASPGDGLIHVVALETARRRDILRFALNLATGRDPARSKGVRHFTCTRLEIGCDITLPVQAMAISSAAFP